MATPIPVIDSKNASRLLVSKFLDTQKSVPDQKGSPPRLVLAMPTSWANKYQVLLYEQAAKHRYAVLGVTTPDELEYVSWPGPIVLHAHWFAAAFRNAKSKRQAELACNKICRSIEAFRDRTGAKLVWSAHNIFPHGNDFPEAFLKLRRWTFETFDAIHVMNDSHVPVLEEAYGVPAPRHFTVPHMTYEESHLDGIEPITARAHFGLAKDATVFGYFGSIQSYKQVDLFLEAFEKLENQRSEPIAAIVAGIPMDDQVVRRLHKRWGGNRNIKLLTRKVEDFEIQYIHRASDAMVLPYKDTLNSGAALMSATFRKPFLMPSGKISRSLEKVGAVGFDQHDPDGLKNAMFDIVKNPTPRIDEKALAELHPKVVSERFFDAVNDLVERNQKT